MNEIIKIILYVLGITIAFIAFWFVDFNRFIRVSKKEFALFVYVVIALAVGFLIGRFFIEFGILFKNIVA